jgi:hypothetical protein
MFERVLGAQRHPRRRIVEVDQLISRSSAAPNLVR